MASPAELAQDSWRLSINRARHCEFFIAQHRRTLTHAGKVLPSGRSVNRPGYVEHAQKLLADRERDLWQALGRIAKAEAVMAEAGIPSVSFFADAKLLGRAA